MNRLINTENINKKEYLKIYEMLFESIKKYNLAMFNILPEVKESLYSHNLLLNTQEWVNEINNLIFDINYSLMTTQAYDEVLQNIDIKYDIEIKRNIYLYTAINNLHSFRNKVSYLFNEILSIPIYKVENNKVTDNQISHNKLDFYKFNKYIQLIDSTLTKLDDKSFRSIQNYFKNLKSIKSSVFEYRNFYIHRASNGIDSFGSGVLDKKDVLGVKENKNLVSFWNQVSDMYPELNFKHLDNDTNFCRTSLPKGNSFANIIDDIKNLIKQYNNYNSQLIENSDIFK